MLLVILFFGVICGPSSANFEDKVHLLTRRSDCCPINPHCYTKQKECSTFWMVISLTLIMLLSILLLLGMAKALIGFFLMPSVGMWGLGVLVDLPRPIRHYEEPDIQHRKVVYDVIGWPIHPDTQTRSVRALTKQTEFCLNLTFFITYPLVMFFDIITLACFKTYDHDEDHDICFEGVNTVMFTHCPGRQSKKTKKDKDKGESTEERDTRYVIQQMYQSEASLKNPDFI